MQPKPNTADPVYTISALPTGSQLQLMALMMHLTSPTIANSAITNLLRHKGDMLF